jgi:hypothetical protein
VDAVMRATGILAIAAIVVIHLVQLVPTFQATPLLGMAFVALIAASLVVGVRLINPVLSRIRLWMPVSMLGAGAIFGYIFTRVANTPIDNQDVGNWACMLGIAALFIESAIVGLSIYALKTTHQLHAVPAATDRTTGTSPTAAVLVQVGSPNGSGRTP